MNAISVTDIMTPNVVCISPQQKLVDVKHIYEKKEFHHHIPVMENNKLVGMVSLLDFMYRINGAGLDDSNEVYSKLTVKDIMTPNPYYLTTSHSVKDIAKILVEGNYHAVPIVDSTMKVVGIVSTADVIKHYLTKESA